MERKSPDRCLIQQIAARCTNGRSDGLRRSILSAREWPVWAVHVTLQSTLSAHSGPWCAAQHGGFGLLRLEWPLLQFWHRTFADAAKVRFPPSLLKSRKIEDSIYPPEPNQIQQSGVSVSERLGGSLGEAEGDFSRLPRRNFWLVMQQLKILKPGAKSDFFNKIRPS